MPNLTPRISGMHARLRKEQGCHDYVLVVISIIKHSLSQAEDGVKSVAVMTYIDFSSAFDLILNSYILKTLKDYDVPAKYCRLVKAVYQSAMVTSSTANRLALILRYQHISRSQNNEW